MIDLSVEVAPRVFDDAQAGDTDALRRVLTDAGASEPVTSSLLASVAAPISRMQVLRAGPDGLVQQQAILGEVGIYHADGTDRDRDQPILIAPSPAELLHTVLAGLPLGAATTSTSSDAHGASEPIGLSHSEQALEAALGRAALPAGIAPPDGRPLRWWALRWTGDDADLPPGKLMALQAQQWWEQRDEVLQPSTALALFGRLADLLDAVSAPSAQPVEAADPAR